MNRRYVKPVTSMALAILAIMFVLSAGGPGASAQENAEPAAKFSLTPVGITGSFFDLAMSPGETQQIEVSVSNTGTADGEALLYMADVTTRVNGGVAAGLAGEPVSSPGLWIDGVEETVAITAGESVTRTFTVEVPDDAAAGEHITSFVVQSAGSAVESEAEAGVMLKTVSRQALPVLVTVEGTVAPALEIGAAEHATAGGSSIVTFTVDNPGNVRLKTSGELTITDSAGDEILRTPVTYNSIYAGDSATFEAPLGFLLQPGDYTVSMWLEDGTHGVRAESGSLALTVPVPPVAAQPANPSTSNQTAETGTASQPVIETQAGGLPTWALLVAIPAAVILGVMLAFLMMKRRMQPASAVASTHLKMVVREIPPVVVNQRVPVRQIVPPGRKGENA